VNEAPASMHAAPPLLGGLTGIVTGAAGGIGQATSKALAREGARLVLVDRDGDAARGLAEHLPTEAVAVRADVTRPDDVEAYVRTATERLGGLDLVFNNAGIEGEVASVGDASAAAWDAVMAVNVTGVWLNLKFAIRAMLAGGRRGSIVNTSSGLGMRGAPQMGAYSASKHAVIGLTKAAALECAPAGIRVNAICPGTVDTPMMASLEKKEGTPGYRQRTEQSIPIGRYGTPEEVAEVVVFLLSDRSAWMTGAALAVDGGRSA
jgi:NAD(P)-dependent dehydrogenase (short-subunit alcohol dehydrogenase family)